MNFDDWMNKEEITNEEFGRRIGLPPSRIVKYRKWKKASYGCRPDDMTMPKLCKATGGEVTPNDFYDLEQTK
ncbi:MAG: hypothetical protein BWY78_00464 [Alphaproteobacteria bacterium ADurb.Bin438]|nr:MAG: hypothetical protein BWY78_00464 [Alphaproteobacteria bacterium ADurb.Bin438]